MDKTRLSLLNLLQAHNEEGWNTFFRTYSDVVKAWIRRCSITDEEDILQEVLLAVFTSIKTFDRERDGSFRRWLRLIVRNRVLASIKKDRNRQFSPIAQDSLDSLAVDDSDPSRMWDEQHERFLLDHAILRLKDDLGNNQAFQAFFAFGVQGRPVQEVAAELGVKPGYVYLCNHRAKKALRDYLADDVV